VLLANGEADPLAPSDHPPRLARLFEAGGADVTLRTFPAGHNLTAGDVTAAQAFLRP
jgi:predicted esterase